MKSGFARSHWKLNVRLLGLVVGLLVVGAAVYVYVGLHSPLP
jgi:hypothetical protein